MSPYSVQYPVRSSLLFPVVSNSHRIYWRGTSAGSRESRRNALPILPASRKAAQARPEFISQACTGIVSIAFQIGCKGESSTLLCEEYGRHCDRSRFQDSAHAR